MTQTITIPASAITIYRRYLSEYTQSNAVFQALCVRDLRGDLKPYEVRLLRKAEDDTWWAKGQMRRLQRSYPGIQGETVR